MIWASLTIQKLNINVRFWMVRHLVFDHSKTGPEIKWFLSWTIFIQKKILLPFICIKWSRLIDHSKNRQTCPFYKWFGTSKLVKQGNSNLAKQTFKNDSARGWNKAPLSIKICSSIYSAKKEIKKFVKTLPV